jgi:ABC-2 type transport system ATP-binding protein
MLDLISRIGGDFGISVIVSSHLLGEIEQICDHLIAIDAGRLLRSATMSSFTQASQVLAIEVDEGADVLAAELARHGLEPVLSGRELLVLIRDAVAGLGLPLTRMEQRRHRVEELFRDSGQEAGRLTGAIDGR